MKTPIILCIMDGYGISNHNQGNCITKANTPNLDNMFKTYPTTYIEASGEYVGLPAGQMGNSEVGHMNIGAGHIIYQSLTLIDKALKDGTFYQNEKYAKAMKRAVSNNKKLHIFGLVSDGGVHSHVNHICGIIKMAKMHGVKELYLHAFTDGRDTDPNSSISYLDQIQSTMDSEGLGHIASISGRYYAMDRDKNLDRIDVSYKVLVDKIGNSFKNYKEYITSQYEYLPTTGKDASDEFLIPAYNSTIDGRIEDGDSIIFMNFRPDRAIQISTLFTNPLFYANPPIKNGSPAWKAYTPEHIVQDIYYVCTMKYADSVNGEIAFTLPNIENTLGEFLANNGYSQLRIAETEKYAHVTFFFDGTKNFDGVERPELKNTKRILINSPKVATYDLKPEMAAYEILEALISELNSVEYDVVILNFANCDMVGHTAVMPAVVKAVETVDECVGKLLQWCNDKGATLLVTADHGNAEKCIDENGNPFTAHTSNPVPFSINKHGIQFRTDGKLSNIAPTIIELLGDTPPAEMTEPSLILK